MSFRAHPAPLWQVSHPLWGNPLPEKHRQTLGRQARSSWHRQTERPPRYGGRSVPSLQGLPRSSERSCILSGTQAHIGRQLGPGGARGVNASLSYVPYTLPLEQKYAVTNSSGHLRKMQLRQGHANMDVRGAARGSQGFWKTTSQKRTLDKASTTLFFFLNIFPLLFQLLLPLLPAMGSPATQHCLQEATAMRQGGPSTSSLKERYRAKRLSKYGA